MSKRKTFLLKLTLLFLPTFLIFSWVFSHPSYSRRARFISRPIILGVTDIRAGVQNISSVLTQRIQIPDLYFLTCWYRLADPFASIPIANPDTGADTWLGVIPDPHPFSSPMPYNQSDTSASGTSLQGYYLINGDVQPGCQANGNGLVPDTSIGYGVPFPELIGSPSLNGDLLTFTFNLHPLGGGNNYSRIYALSINANTAEVEDITNNLPTSSGQHTVSINISNIRPLTGTKDIMLALSAVRPNALPPATAQHRNPLLLPLGSTGSSTINVDASIFTLGPAPMAPAPVENLTAAPLAPSSPDWDLNWTIPAAVNYDATGGIEVQTGTGSLVASLPGTATTYRLTNIPFGTTPTFQVVGIESGIPSPPTPVVLTPPTLPAAPDAVVASGQILMGQISITQSNLYSGANTVEGWDVTIVDTDTTTTIASQFSANATLNLTLPAGDHYEARVRTQANGVLSANETVSNLFDVNAQPPDSPDVMGVYIGGNNHLIEFSTANPPVADSIEIRDVTSGNLIATLLAPSWLPVTASANRFGPIDFEARAFVSGNPGSPASLTVAVIPDIPIATYQINGSHGHTISLSILPDLISSYADPSHTLRLDIREGRLGVTAPIIASPSFDLSLGVSTPISFDVNLPANHTEDGTRIIRVSATIEDGSGDLVTSGQNSATYEIGMVLGDLNNSGRADIDDQCYYIAWLTGIPDVCNPSAAITSCPDTMDGDGDGVVLVPLRTAEAISFDPNWLFCDSDDFSEYTDDNSFLISMGQNNTQRLAPPALFAPVPRNYADPSCNYTPFPTGYTQSGDCDHARNNEAVIDFDLN